MLRARWVVLVWLAGCGVRAPRPVDVAQLVATKGPLEARRDLVVRVTSAPRDVAGWLALAALDDQQGRPSGAIEALEAVERLGGPIGTRWHDEDRARLARLIAVRGRARLARGASSAVADLERARRLGAQVIDDEIWQARVAAAVGLLRHSDAATRAEGRRALAGLVRPAVARRAVAAGGGVAGGDADSSSSGGAASGSGAASAATDGDAWPTLLAGAQAGATAEQRGRSGARLWALGARRAAWDELSAWHAATRAPRDAELQQAYLIAARWWMPFDRPGPPDEDLVGAWRCAFAACAPREVVGDAAREQAWLSAPIAAPVREAEDVAASIVIALHQALRGEVSWGPAVAARVDAAALGDGRFAGLPGHVQAIVARWSGRDAAIPSDGGPETRVAIAAARALAGAGTAEVVAAAGDSPYAAELSRVAAPRPPFTGDALAEAVVRHVGATAPPGSRADELRAIVAAYVRDPAIADRLGRDAVAAATDAAAMQAALGALFDALGDPARARLAWQTAVDASAEWSFLRGLAEAQARQGDGDAALIAATTAAAASGDPAVVWASVARALVGAGRYVHGLEAARNAIDLAGPETIAGAFDVAIAASRALGRDAQAAGLEAQRGRVALRRATISDADPTDAHGALDAHQRQPSAATLARLWTAARWNPRDVALRVALLTTLPTDDARRPAVLGELVDLAGDRDLEVRRAAVAALMAARR